MNKYVIIGNGTAAVGCIEGIRSTDTEGKITVISEENHQVYGRPLISYYLQKKTNLENMNYRPRDFYEKNGCDVIYGKKAVHIDTEAKAVILNDGTHLDYTCVCVATGSSPFVPTLDGLETVEKKFSFMTLDDTLALEKAVNSNSRVLIVGAGLIGLKCAEGLRAITPHITVCDLAYRVLSSILDGTCASMIQNRLQENDISFLLGDSVSRFTGNKAVMQSGKTVEFDVLVLAVGVRANTSLVKEIGGDVGKGIVVNTKMETSLPLVYAAGDCTEGDDISSGTKKVLALLPNAYMQGNCAGVNMAGGNDCFDKAIPMNSIGFFGLHAMTAGSYDGECFEEKTNAGLKRFYVKDGILMGFMLIGETARVGILTSLIREKTPLAEIDFELLKKITTSAVFSSKMRRNKFGGVV